MFPSTGQQKIALPGVKTILAIASGKGVVGKSTVVTNLALALQMHGNRVGLVDANIYGPSIPRMMGVPGVVDQSITRMPMERYSIKLMSVSKKTNTPIRYQEETHELKYSSTQDKARRLVDDRPAFLLESDRDRIGPRPRGGSGT